MIIVLGKAHFDPAALAGFGGTLKDLMAATRAEDGCLDYTLAVEDAEAGIVAISERWANAEALNAHVKTPHVAAFQEAAAGHMKSMDVKLYDASNERGIR